MTQLCLNKKIAIAFLILAISSPCAFAGALSITTATLSSANVGLTYRQSLMATGGTPPYSWSITGGVLPSGLGMNVTGVISGTPSTPVTSSLTFMVLDSASPRQFISTTKTLLVGRTFYVDSAGGNDSNSGADSSHAWKTLAKVGKTLYSPGDAILLKRGAVWNETLTVPSSGTSVAPITIGAYGSGSAPLIDGKNTLFAAISVNQHGYIQISNIAMQNLTGYGVELLSSPYSTVSYCTFKNIAEEALKIGSSSPHVTIDHNSFTNDPGVHSIKFLYFYSTTSDYPIVSNNTIGELGAHFGIVIEDGNNATIYGNTVTGNGHGITIEAVTRNVTGGQIYDNTVYNSSNQEGDGENISLTGNNGFVVTASIYRNFVKGGPYTVNGIGGYNVTRCQVYNNLVMNVPLGSGIHFTQNATNSYFYNNDIYNTNTEGFGLFNNSTGNVVMNNIVDLVKTTGIDIDNSSLPITEDYNVFNLVGVRPVQTNMTMGRHSVISDPQFSASAPQTAADFRLKAGSPAIDTGAALALPYNWALNPSGLTMPYAILDQNQVGTGWERGAFVYTSSSQSATITTLTSSLNPAKRGTAVTFKAVVTSSKTGIIGNIQFKDGSVVLAVVPSSLGTATFTTTTLAPGTHAITAHYNGHTGFSTSTSAALAEAVN